MTTAQTEKKAVAAPSPDRLLQLGTGFWASKVFLAALKFDLFSVLGDQKLTAEEIQKKISLHPRGTSDFLDTLVALGVLVRADGAYANTPESRLFFDRSSPHYMGSMLEMANERLYEIWGRLETALTTGKPQNETLKGGNIFDHLYSDPRKLNLFLKAMIGLSKASSAALVKIFDFSRHQVFCDVGGGPGTLAVEVARAFPRLKIINFDLPPAEAVFVEYVAENGLSDRIRFHPGDCLQDSLPAADLYALGHVLHGWGGSAETHQVLRKTYDALPKGGELLIIESFIDDARRHNAFGLLMSLDMLLETEKGRNFTAKEALDWVKDAGFHHAHYQPLVGPTGVVIARK